MRSIKKNKLYLLAFISETVILVAASFLVIQNFDRKTPETQSKHAYEIINVYPHDPEAFTQGLAYSDGLLYEGTGFYNESSLRRIELKTGKILQIFSLPHDLFGEGITIFKNEVIQLTWLEHRGLVYDRQTFKMLRDFSYTTQGWGLTNNGSHLIMSDGTANLYFLNPVTFEVVGQVEVKNDSIVTGLNELEYVKGEIYANVWHEQYILRIDPKSGQVKGWIDLSKLVDYDKLGPEDVLNGIAYNSEDDLMYVTGKRWPQLFEIRLNSIDYS